MIDPRIRKFVVATILTTLVAASVPSGQVLAQTSEPAASSRPSAGPTMAITPEQPVDVVTGLRAPWSVVFVGDTPLVSERDSGVIRELLGDRSTREVGTVPGVAHGGEGGLLGLAIDDDGRLYAYSTGPNGNRVQRFGLDGEPGSYALGAVETLVDGLPSARYHNGGRIGFGPDGMLYVSVGDAGQRSSAQDLQSMAGKILRMTPDGGVPSDNPFTGSLVFSYGHRNVQGLGWAQDGTMFASEFGQDTWDELNVIVAGSDYGWPTVEGAAGDPRFVDPVQQWTPERASPSGIAVVGDTILIANLRGQLLRAVPVADPSIAEDHDVGELGRLRDVVAAPDGTLWLVTNNTDGRGTPSSGDDRIVSVGLALAEPLGDPVTGSAPRGAAARRPFKMDLYRKGDHVAQFTGSWCVGASMQMMINMIEPGAADRTRATQRRLYRLAREVSPWVETRPGASAYGWAEGLEALGHGGYDELTAPTLREALRIAATQMRATRRPVGLLVWEGAHAWVMSGFRATADPAVTNDFRVTHVWVEDPFTDRVSRVWGRGLEPHTRLSVKALAEDYVRYGRRWYGSDGMYVLVAPVDDPWASIDP